MISVVIPVFNYNVCTLVSQLHAQLLKTGIIFEIIIFDDASTSQKIQQENAAIAHLERTTYQLLPENLGFCKIRNVLAEAAQYPNLLFLDADAILLKNEFVSNYLPYLNSGKVICGGCLYAALPPTDTNLILKWRHGKQREEASAEQRSLYPYRTFWAGNFLIPKASFKLVDFDEGSPRYGYNDTVFGYRLQEANIPIVHIANPVLNEGLMHKDKFIGRVNDTIKNLLYFEQRPYINPDTFNEFIKVQKTYIFLKKNRLINLFQMVFRFLKPLILKNLNSTEPQLKLLDIYKLGILIEERKNQSTL